MPSKTEVKEWYNKRWESRRDLLKSTYSKRSYESHAVYIDYLKVQKGKKILDIGCGHGTLLLIALERGLKTYGIDISDEAVKIAKNISPKSNIAVGDAENLKFKNSTFDYITCIGVLEHLLDMNKALDEIKRVSKKDALFCFMVPNSNFIFWKIIGKKGTDQQAINESLLSLKQWKNLFINRRFEIIKVYKDKGYTKNRIFSKNNKLANLEKYFYRLIWNIIPLKYTYHFNFVLKKKD